MRRLILAPHYDDEILGCGGIIAKYESDDFYVAHATKCDDNRMHEWSEILGECKNILKYFNFGYRDSGFTKEGTMSYMGISHVARSVASVIKVVKPDIVYIPFKSLHQDHRYLHTAALIALRSFNGSILEYEYTDQFSQYNMLEVDYYERLNHSQITKKCYLMELYKSQINSHRDSEAIKALAKIRGYSAQTEYAEGFNLIRCIK